MTSTELEPAPSTGAQVNDRDLTDGELISIAAGVINALSRRYNAADPASEAKARLGRGWHDIAQAFLRRGRVTLELRQETWVSVLDGEGSKVMGPDELEQAGWPHEQIAPRRVFQHLDLESLRDGAVITVDVPRDYIYAERVVADPTRIALPDNWAADLASALANVPAPVVEVSNNVETPEVNVNITNEPDDSAMSIDFSRDRHGLISGAKVKPAE